jgi:signal peptidase II
MLRLGLRLAALVALLDQATKWGFYAWLTGLAFWDRAPVPLPRGPVVEAAPFLNFVVVWNHGVSCGMFNRGSDEAAWILVLVALAITGAMAWWLARAPSRLVAAALGLVIGGALGNVVDRIRFGAVFDFVDLHAAGWHWPAFNVADAAIVAGAGLLLLDALFAPKPSAK